MELAGVCSAKRYDSFLSNCILQLSEVYSSFDEFHLELPTGDFEGPKQIWSVPAFLTKPIIRLRFQASSQKNHTAYIRYLLISIYFIRSLQFWSISLPSRRALVF